MNDRDPSADGQDPELTQPVSSDAIDAAMEETAVDQQVSPYTTEYQPGLPHTYDEAEGEVPRDLDTDEITPVDRPFIGPPKGYGSSDEEAGNGFGNPEEDNEYDYLDEDEEYYAEDDSFKSPTMVLAISAVIIAVALTAGGFAWFKMNTAAKTNKERALEIAQSEAKVAQEEAKKALEEAKKVQDEASKQAEAARVASERAAEEARASAIASVEAAAKEASEKAASEKAASEKAASERAMREREASEKAASERARESERARLAASRSPNPNPSRIGRPYPAPNENMPLGSGCEPGPGVLPDGFWYGYAWSNQNGSMDIDIVCLYTNGNLINDNQTIRTVWVNEYVDPNGRLVGIEVQNNTVVNYWQQ